MIRLRGEDSVPLQRIGILHPTGPHLRVQGVCGWGGFVYNVTMIIVAFHFQFYSDGLTRIQCILCG